MMTSRSPLPAIEESRIDALESRLFDELGTRRERARRIRRRTVLGGGAAVAVLVVAGIVGPLALSGAPSVSADRAVVEALPQPVADAPFPQDASVSSAESLPAEAADTGVVSFEGRTIVSSADLRLRVEDVRAGVDRVEGIVRDLGGYAQSVSQGDDAPVAPLRTDPAREEAPRSAWMQLRVPSDRLDEALDELAAVGTVVSSFRSADDVTDYATDISARLAAAEESTARLRELLSQTTNLSDLIAAESALTERQASLDALRQQVESLQSQVSLSSVTVQLSATETVEPDAGGFTGGLLAGRHGLVAAFNGIVIGLGFLLPWLGVLVVVGTLVWGVRALIVRRRRPEEQ